MEDNKDLKKEKKKKGSNEDNKSTFFSSIKQEFKKITWPNRQTLMKQTGTVIVTSILIGIMVVGMDFAFGSLYYAFVQILG